VNCVYWTNRRMVFAQHWLRDHPGSHGEPVESFLARSCQRLSVMMWTAWLLFVAQLAASFFSYFVRSGSVSFLMWIAPGAASVVLPWALHPLLRFTKSPVLGTSNKSPVTRHRATSPPGPAETDQDELRPVDNTQAETPPDPKPGSYNVFISYNSKDRDEVLPVAKNLQKAGLQVWLDQWELRPGLPWQRALEQAIDSIAAAAVFVGSNRIGPWQTLEMEMYLRQFVNRGCPVIPVLLPGCPAAPPLPLFLAGMTWVDFRSEHGVAFERLVWGITGRRPGSGALPPAS
jgi:nucleotide-binding universal stress UspA family protein